MKTDVLLTTFDRPTHLELSLRTLCSQPLRSLGCRVVVINDGRENDTRAIAERYGAEYLFTGQRNMTGVLARPPGFALNVAIQRSAADLIVLTNGDVYHIGETVAPVLQAAERHPCGLITVEEVLECDGRLLNCFDRRLRASAGCVAKALAELRAIPDEVRDQAPRADPRMPYFAAVRREHLLNIGGYDEDFIGYACEDTDIMERLCEYGCYYVYTEAEVAHLFHGTRAFAKDCHDYTHNLQLLQSRKGQCVRNAGRPWGVAESSPGPLPTVAATSARSLVVCVEYDDFLAITLPRNKRHFAQTVVVTRPGDTRTQELAKREGVECYVTDAFFQDGAPFNKGVALEEAFDHIGRDGWLCIWDADTVLPENFSVPAVNEGHLYVPKRRVLEYPTTFRDGMDWGELPSPTKAGAFDGYCQLFHASAVPARPWYATDSQHAGLSDSEFSRHFADTYLSLIHI